jgi:hypothetical protein
MNLNRRILWIVRVRKRGNEMSGGREGFFRARGVVEMRRLMSWMRVMMMMRGGTVSRVMLKV